MYKHIVQNNIFYCLCQEFCIMERLPDKFDIGYRLAERNKRKHPRIFEPCLG